MQNNATLVCSQILLGTSWSVKLFKLAPRHMHHSPASECLSCTIPDVETTWDNGLYPVERSCWILPLWGSGRYDGKSSPFRSCDAARIYTMQVFRCSAFVSLKFLKFHWSSLSFWIASELAASLALVELKHHFKNAWSQEVSHQR